MRVVSLLQPAATLTVTREVCDCDPVWLEGHRAGDHASDRCDRMVSRWVTFDYACPEGVVGTRIAIHATKTPPKVKHGRVGDWRYDRYDGEWYARPVGTGTKGFITGGLLPLGVVVGSAIVEASYPIVGEHDNPLPKPWIERTDQDLLHLVRWDGWTDISDQLPYCDWSPGRFAWLLADAAPCQERCPRCNGTGLFRDDLGGRCPVCDMHRRCGPVRWVSSGGRLPEWQPT